MSWMPTTGIVDDGETEDDPWTAGVRPDRVDGAVDERAALATRTMHTTARAARQLPGGRGGAVHDPGDLVERHGEHVVQHERDAFRRSQHVEDDQQRGSDRVGQHSLLFRITAVGHRGQPLAVRLERCASQSRSSMSRVLVGVRHSTDGPRSVDVTDDTCVDACRDRARRGTVRM